MLLRMVPAVPRRRLMPAVTPVNAVEVGAGATVGHTSVLHGAVLGEEALVFYRATNLSQRPIVGTATYNVTPDIAGAWFNKIQCFCFNEQRLDPGQSIDMPVSFFIDPEILTDRDGGGIHEITLSYTFYPAVNQKAVEKATTPVQSAQKG